MIGRFKVLYKIPVLWCLLIVSATTSANDFQVGGHAYLCVQHTLNPNWPEFFAIKVEVVALMAERVRVKVVNHYPLPGRINEEVTPVRGDVMKISRARVYSQSQAGVSPGNRFEGKPVCSKLMPES